MVMAGERELLSNGVQKEGVIDLQKSKPACSVRIFLIVMIIKSKLQREREREREREGNIVFAFLMDLLEWTVCHAFCSKMTDLNTSASYCDE